MHGLSLKQLEVLRALAAGATVTAAAEAAGLHRTTVHHWCRNLPEFRSLHEELKSARADSVLEEIHALTAPALAILRKALQDEATPLSLQVRIALALLKHASAQTPGPGLKAVAVDSLVDAAYDAGLRAAREEAALEANDSLDSEPVAERDAAPPSPEIHHNSSEFITNSENPRPQRNTPRNAPCPCHSGLKFKKCCGSPGLAARAA